MTFLLIVKGSSSIACHYACVNLNRGRLWRSWNFFRHWTWPLTPIRVIHSLTLFSFFLSNPSFLFSSSQPLPLLSVACFTKRLIFRFFIFISYYFCFSLDGPKKFDSRVSVPSHWRWVDWVFSEEEGSG